MGTVPQREADLLPLWAAVQRAASPAAKVEALAALHAETGRRLEVDTRVRKAVGHLLAQPEVLSAIQVKAMSCSHYCLWGKLLCARSCGSRRGKCWCIALAALLLVHVQRALPTARSCRLLQLSSASPQLDGTSI